MDEQDQKAYDMLTLKNPGSEDHKLFVNAHNFFCIVNTADKLIIWCILRETKDGLADKKAVIDRVIDINKHKETYGQTPASNRDYLGDRLDRLRQEGYINVNAKRMSKCWQTSITLTDLANTLINDMLKGCKVLIRDKAINCNCDCFERLNELSNHSNQTEEEEVEW